MTPSRFRGKRRSARRGAADRHRLDQAAHRIRRSCAPLVSDAGRPGGLLLRSPALEEAERWIASRPPRCAGADRRDAGFRRRRAGAERPGGATSSPAALRPALWSRSRSPALAYWQRGIAVEQQRVANEQRQIAEQQRKRAEDTLAAATKTANSLVYDLAQRFRDTVGVPAALVKDILDRARALAGAAHQIRAGDAGPQAQRGRGALGTLQIRCWRSATRRARSPPPSRRDKSSADLLAGNPDSTDWQRDLSVSYEKVGDVQVAQGDLAGALKSYRDSLAIRDRLAKSDPGNAGWQRDLSVSYDKVGDVQAGARRPCGRAEVLPRQPRHLRPAGEDPIPATPAGSAICRCRTTRSATCRWRRATLPAR